MIMCEQSERNLLDPLVNRIVANLGKDFDDVRYEVSVPENSFFISNLYFLNINSNAKDTDKRGTVNVVLKKPPVMPSVRDVMRTNEQFHNEILFYQRYAKHHEEFPRCVLAEDKPPSDSAIVLENVILQRGYDVSKWKHDIPVEYTMAAFREIARFHGKAYAAKEQRGEEFFDFVNDLQEVRYYPGSILKVVYDETASRSVGYLRERGYDRGFCDKLEDKLRSTYDDLIMKYVQPEEPLATLCHGDFTVNNTLFKKEKNGEIKCMFIDFALTRYGSPVLDLSTFLCLHCAKQIDKSMLEKVLREYHDSLTRCLEENGVDCEKYPYEVLREDYKRKGLFGFFIATFFLPTVMGHSDGGPEKLFKMDLKDWGPVLREQGGDECSEIMANMLLGLKEFGCLDDLLGDH